MKIGISSVCKAFEASTVGTKADPFVWDILAKAVGEHDPSKDRAPGQHFVLLPETALSHVSAGVGRRTENPCDYVVRVWRGRCEAFLRREKAEKATGVACVVYTREAYGADPDVTAEEQAQLGDATHVLVAVLAFAGPGGSPPAPWTFVRNLAGANREEMLMTDDEIRSKAKAVAEYHAEWCVVAD
jgi:hypothetical protein